jgi:ABC-type polysaccharide/polyol phosphate transport system ATPase subunit
VSAPGTIEVDGVSKAYRIYAHPRDRLREALWRGRRSFHRDFWALRDVTFRVAPGTTCGVVGLNGSGKSTLLQVVAGIVEPTAGAARVHGRVAALLELGAGFNPEFTGRENVLMQGAITGFTRDEMLARLPRIEAFAEIGAFLDQPVKTYSSGMFVRLAFAAAVHVDPDVLLVDEALAVGDAVFQHRCIRRIRELQEQGKTILFVSHDIGTVKAVCGQAVLLHAGQVEALGDPADVAQRYRARIAQMEEVPTAAAPAPGAGAAPGGRPALFAPDPGFDQRAGLFRHGTGAARIRNVEVLHAAGGALAGIPFGAPVVLRVHVECHEEVPFWILGFFVRDRSGIDVLGTNTYEEGVAVPPRRAGDAFVVDFGLDLPLQPGTYSLTVALGYRRDSATPFDWIDNARVIEVLPPPGGKVVHAKVGLPVAVTVHT